MAALIDGMLTMNRRLEVFYSPQRTWRARRNKTLCHGAELATPALTFCMIAIPCPGMARSYGGIVFFTYNSDDAARRNEEI